MRRFITPNMRSVINAAKEIDPSATNLPPKSFHAFVDSAFKIKTEVTLSPEDWATSVLEQIDLPDSRED